LKLLKRNALALMGLMLMGLMGGAGAQNNGTLVGSPPFAASSGISSTNNAANFGQCVTFNGSGQYITMPGSTFAFTGGVGTFECRVRTTTTTGTTVFAGYTATNATIGSWWVGNVSGVCKASIQGFSSAATFGTASISDGAWHHVALVMTSGTSATLYVDGVAAGTQTGTYTVGTATFWSTLGALQISGSSTPNYSFAFAGSVDEAAMWTTAKYTSSFTPPTSPYANSTANLTALYHLDGNANDSTTLPASTLYSLSLSATTGVQGSAVTLTYTPNGTTTATVTPAQTGVSGTFSPATIALNGTAPVAVTFTPSSQGTAVFTSTNNGGLTNPSNQNYVVTASVAYTETDATSPAYSQNVMVLVPNTNAAIPYNSANPTTLVIYCHGAGETERALLTDTLKASSVTAFLNAGYILAGSAAHGTGNWGNQASVDDYADLYNYCAANYNVGKVILWGQSMGGLDSLMALAENKVPNVVGWIGTYPVCNLANLYSLGTYASQIATAYSITGTAPATYANMTYGNDPVLKWGAAFRSVPMRFYASPSDTVVPKANNTDVLAALVAGSSREHAVIVCSGNHGDPSHFQPSDYLSFIQRCLATPVANTGQIGTTPLGTFTHQIPRGR
jgi:alpha-beta hydrolase superfamily lysophospholipase